MREAVGDVFSYGKINGEHSKRIARVIPTNGMTDASGRAIMGRGVALQAASRYRNLPTRLGALILSDGNHAHEVAIENGPIFVSFPTKYDWRKPADLRLIERSARELLSLLNDRGYELVVMPRPGVGNGNLPWKEVKSIIGEVFKGEDRIVVVSLYDPDDPNDLPMDKKWR